MAARSTGIPGPNVGTLVPETLQPLSVVSCRWHVVGQSLRSHRRAADCSQRLRSHFVRLACRENNRLLLEDKLVSSAISSLHLFENRNLLDRSMGVKEMR